MNENVLSLEEIMMGWNEKCYSLNCEDCKFNDDSLRYPCKAQYAHAILTGKMKLTDSFRKEEPKPEPKLPGWCKVGAWVTEGDPAHRLGVIDRVFSNSRVNVTWFHTDGFTGSNSLTKYLKPVKFRPYTFDEAKKLLGKVMECVELDEDGVDSGHRVYELVTSVHGRDGDEPYINWYTSRNFAKRNATIDGIPVGVPEVDEEALKGGQE